MGIDREPWRDQAACRHHPNPSWWFSEAASDPESLAATERAKAVCRGCLVRQECLTEAVRRREQHGVWGGLVFPDEWRRAMRLRPRAGDLEDLARDSDDAVPDVRTA